MMQAVEASLERLKTDYIDLYWVHVWDQITPLDEVMRGLDDRVRRKVLYLGISDARSHSMSCPLALLVRMADRLKSRM
jgi:aryl-alcohol dehydrogenase-like predicted oxidoreductase